jgi:hypothetical protein
LSLLIGLRSTSCDLVVIPCTPNRYIATQHSHTFPMDPVPFEL